MWLLAFIALATLITYLVLKGTGRRYVCPVCDGANSRSIVTVDACVVAPCQHCQSWLLLRLGNSTRVEEHVARVDFDLWIPYSGSRFAALEALERKWGITPTELKSMRSEHATSELFGSIFQLLGFVLVVVLLILLVWAAVSATRWAWHNPLF